MSSNRHSSGTRKPRYDEAIQSGRVCCRASRQTSVGKQNSRKLDGPPAAGRHRASCDKIVAPMTDNTMTNDTATLQTELRRMSRPLDEVDPEIAAALRDEVRRQATGIELIPSENFVSEAVLEAMGSVMANKYAEGYGEKRYYGGCEFVNQRRAARDRPRETAFRRRARQRAAAFRRAGEHGRLPGHAEARRHGARHEPCARRPPDARPSAEFFGADLQIRRLRRDAKKPKPSITMNSTASRKNTSRKWSSSARARIRASSILRAWAKIAQSVGALLFVDMAHIAGLVAAGIHPSPVPHADFVSTTTHKTLRGPRGGMILCREKYAKDIDRSLFPGVQGGPLMHVIAAKAVCFKEALEPGFREYQQAGRRERESAGRRRCEARLPHRQRRHGQSSFPDRHSLARTDRKRRATCVRPRRHHHQQELHSLRSPSADESRRHSRRHARRHDARHARARNGNHRRMDRRDAFESRRRCHRTAHPRPKSRSWARNSLYICAA